MGILYETSIAINNDTKANKNLEYTGKISWLGRTTGLPKDNREVEFFPGPVMSFRRSALLEAFDGYIFYIFENRIAMAEDKVISMRVSKKGRLWYIGDSVYIKHPPIPSTYYENDMLFHAKVVFSRLWFNFEYAYIRNKSSFLSIIIFIAYILKLVLHSVIRIDSSLLKGIFIGLKYCILYNKRGVDPNLLEQYFNVAQKDIS